jgi:hypothetical protein
MIFAPASVRLIVWLAILMALPAAVFPRNAMGADIGLPNACWRWPQNQLIVDGGLQSRHFMLEARGEAQAMPPSLGGGARKIYHRTFGLSLDVAEPIALFKTRSAKTCVIARDKEKTLPVRVPVFFVGRSGQSLDDLRADAERAAFAPSGALGAGKDFAEVTFYLRKGASRFSDIRPFFACGLPGLMLCEGYCPGDTQTLAGQLVDWVVKGVTWGQQANAGQSEEAPPPPPAPPPAPRESARPLPAPPPAGQEAAPPLPAPPPVRKEIAPPPLAQEATPPEHPDAAPVPPPNPDALRLPAPALPAPPPPQRETEPNPPLASRPTRQIVLALERKDGSAINAADVFAAEESVKLEGVPLTALAGGLAAELPQDAFPGVNSLETLQRAFPHYRISAVKIEESRTVLTAEPLFVAVGDLTIKITDAAHEPAGGCDLALDVLPNRRLGRGWAKAAEAKGARGLKFKAERGGYIADLPANVSKGELLIATDEPGNAAQLSNVAGACELETKLLVTAEELRSGTILRSLRETGPILFALLSTDSDFSEGAGIAEAEGFWSNALDLAGAVSEGPWKRKLLARAQSPGASIETGLVQILQGADKLAQGEARAPIFRELLEGSRPNPGLPAITGSKPIKRFELDLAMEPIRRDAGIVPRDSERREALLLITGGIDSYGSYFCRYPMRRNMAPWAHPQWVKRARNVFVLEVWSEAEAQALQRNSRAKPAEGAPNGIYSCNIPSAGGAGIALYGVVPAALAEGARTGVFAYLTERANSYLKP